MRRMPSSAVFVSTIIPNCVKWKFPFIEINLSNACSYCDECNIRVGVVKAKGASEVWEAGMLRSK